MKKNYYTLLSFSILTALYGTSSWASLQQRCLAGIPHFTGEVVQTSNNDLPVYIEADRAELNQPVNARYEGDVEIKQGNRHLTTQVVEVVQTGEGEVIQRTAYAKEGFDYKDNLINVLGQSAKINLNNKDADINAADYQFVGRQGRGRAEQVELREDYRLLKNATFTSCLPDDNSWMIEASEMRQHIKEEYAEMWHARLKVHGVPIFYTPYLQLPIGDRRRSGLLMPTAGHSSRDGYWYNQPIYWNIAPNFDMTITPKFMSKRGWQFNGEARYLTQIGEGVIAGEYLGNDRYDDYQGENRSRHLFHWQHSSSFLENWRLNVDYTKVSDKRYFTDFDSNYGSSTDGYADQNFRIAYYQPNYNLSISGKQFQVFDEPEIGPYRVLPQIDFNYYRNDLADGRLDFKFFSQIARFENDSTLMPKAWRFHLEPSLNFPLSNRYGSLNIETKLYATHYNQTKGSSANAEVQRSVNRVLPQVKVDFQTLLANKESFIQGYTQTLEPHIQYLYRPYKDQSDIGAKLNSQYLGFGYDSALLQQDYFSLFRDRRYSGLDRIASANQFTFGGTTRFYDESGNERFNLSVGQIYYMSSSRIDNNSDNTSHRSSSSWSLETNWLISPQWNWRVSYQYDPSLHQTSLANSVLEFNPSGNNLVQLSYRYASREYIDQNLTGAKAYNQDIKQLGVTAAWEIADNWAVVGRYYQDLALKKPVEQYVGIRYNSCCWSAGIGVRRYVTSKEGQKADQVLYDNGISVNFELRGLGTNDHRSGIEKMLKSGKLPYIQSFSLY
ncbi:LPS assembly protein LptD [Avibacterium paragallinarum]|uniref:LPS assembly protein LptD n=1 Tax=Avibacterium paragallinarum TaxID=728 RepID=UPI0006152A21|nr:LPS assembly protein LptD [Avibacterium paragallinarum]QIR12513.1 LPS assembly protein LptD [Avibacterium paragallinarum]QLD65640.1 LPS assembly protein LptD [Avibacterium paragallinarum]